MSKQTVKEALNEYADNQMPANPNVWSVVRWRIISGSKLKTTTGSSRARLIALGVAASIVVLVVFIAIMSFSSTGPTSNLPLVSDEIILQTRSGQVNQEQLEGIRQVITKRLNWLGVGQFSVQLLNGDLIQVQASGIRDVANFSRRSAKQVVWNLWMRVPTY